MKDWCNEVLLFKARDGGFVVSLPGRDGYRTTLLFAGTLDRCLAYMRDAFEDPKVQVKVD